MSRRCAGRRRSRRRRARPTGRSRPDPRSRRPRSSSRTAGRRGGRSAGARVRRPVSRSSSRPPRSPERVLELAHARAELAAQPRQPLGPEDQQHDDEDDDQLGGPKGMVASRRGGPPSGSAERPRRRADDAPRVQGRRWRGPISGLSAPPTSCDMSPIRSQPLRPARRPALRARRSRSSTSRTRPSPAPRAATPARTTRPSPTSTSAATCDSDLVYPIEWDEAGAAHWEVTLRCPNCEWIGSGVFEQEIVERFDEELDRGTEALVRDLRRLTHANMEDEIERFVTRARRRDRRASAPTDFVARRRAKRSAPRRRRPPARARSARPSGRSPAARPWPRRQLERALAGRVQRAGRGDPVAERLRLLRAS